MLNSAIFLLLKEIINGAVASVKVLFNVLFAYVMYEVKIEIVNLAFFKLLFENFLVLSKIVNVVSGKF